MKTPVVIPAHNEAELIGRTLDSLDANTVDPLVVTNGCTDNTTEIARSFGAATIELGEAGKLPAIQFALEHLGNRALEPVLLLDADSRPLMPRRWERSMLQARHNLPADTPAVVIGSILFTNMADPATAAWKNLTHARHQFRTRHSTTRGGFSGGNMLLDLKTDDARTAVLELPHIWQGDDVATKDAVIQQGGSVRKSLDIRTAIVTDGSRYPSIMQRLRQGSASYRQAMIESYNRDAATGSMPYSEWNTPVATTDTAQ